MAADRAMRGYALAHDEGEDLWLFGQLVTIKISAWTTRLGSTA